MQARLKNPIMILPDALPALLALNKAAEAGLPYATRKLVHVRASQINGCSVCVDMHSRELKKAGETDERLFAVAAWRDAPYFTEAERAALALTEAVTRLSDRADPVPDEIWNEAARYYDEPTLAALLVQIGLINVFNRLNVATRQVAGEWIKQQEAKTAVGSHNGGR
jgi:AhpD family alkylhydroperoxidase